MRGAKSSLPAFSTISRDWLNNAGRLPIRYAFGS
jgi:hypothetical protein